MKNYYSSLRKFIQECCGTFVVLLFALNQGSAQTTVNLGAAAPFAVLANSSISNSGGNTVIYGDMGISPGNTITGFPPGIVHGTTHINNTTAANAQTALTTAYNDAAGRTPTANITGVNLGGLTFSPGVYRSNSGTTITGKVTLDAGGNPNAVFIFQVANSFVTSGSAIVELVNGAQAANVFWQVGTVATLSSGTIFNGTILSNQSITANTGTDVTGRLLARSSAVIFVGNVNVNFPYPLAQANLIITKTVSAGPYNVGDTIVYTIIARNSGPDTATNVTVKDSLVAGLTFISVSANKGTYNSTTGIFTIDTLLSGEIDTIRIMAMISGSGPILNTAIINGSEFDTAISNNRDSVFICVNPKVTLGSDTLVCGSSLLLDAGNAGSAFSFSTGATSQTITVTTSGKYYVTVTNGCGGVTTDTINVVISPPPSVNLGVDDTVCGTAILNAGNPGSSFMWSTGEKIQSIAVSLSGTYYVNVTTAAGCSASDTVNITIRPVPSVNLGTDTARCGGSVTLDAGNPGSTYLWSTGATTQTINVTTSGNYSVNVTNGFGCTGSDNINVNFTSSLKVDLGKDTARCGGSVTLDAGNSGSTYLWNTGSTSRTISALVSGTYFVTVTNSFGCTGRDTINVNLGAPLTVNLGADTTLCGGSLVLDAGNAGANYLWNTGATSRTITVSSSGTYYVGVINGFGCIDSDSINVTFSSALPVKLGNDFTSCGPAVLNAGHPGATYDWSTGATTQSINVTGSGIYAVKVTNSFGCIGYDTITVTVNPKPVVNLGADTTQCGGNITLNAGNSGSSYLWSTGATTQTINVTTTGSYAVKVTNGSGCIATDTITVTFTSDLDVQLGSDTAKCGGIVTLNAGFSGSTYVWSTGATTQTINVTGSGTYSVTVTNGFGCIGKDTINVTFQSTLNVQLGADFTQCGPAVLDAGHPGSAYAWNTGDTTRTLAINNSGTYSVKVTNFFGCIGYDTINVVINPNPIVNLGPDTTLCSGPLVLDAGNVGASYQWSTGASTRTVSVNQTGTYAVLVSNSFCSMSDTVFVNFKPTTVIVNLGPDTIQCGGQKIFDAGNPGYSYLWNTGATSRTITATISGTYSVKVTSPIGCAGSDSVNLTIKAAPIVDLGPDIIQCGGTIFLNAGNPGSVFQWSTGATTQTINVTSSGTYSVYVLGTSGCEEWDTIDITINPLPIVNLGSDSTRCGETVTLDAGNPGSTYAWNTGASTQSIVVPISGTYYVIVTDSLGCSNSDTTNVNFISFLMVDLGEDEIFCGGSIVLDASNSGSEYSWNTGDTTQTITADSTGIYMVRVENQYGCLGYDTIDLVFNTPPFVNLGPDTSLCAAAYLLDAGNPGASYLWNTGDTTQTATVKNSGKYTVFVTNGAGCSAVDTVLITLREVPVVNLGRDTMACGSNYSIDAGNPGSTYAWNTGASSQSIVVITPATYSVKVTNAAGCSASDTVTVGFQATPDRPKPIQGDFTPCSGGEVTYSIPEQTGATDYLWSAPSGWTILSGQGTNTIKVKSGFIDGQIGVTVSNGICKSPVTTLDVIPVAGGEDINIPNAFTPNNDGRNDNYVIRNIDKYAENELVVVNRWGNEVYRQKSYNNTWDGSDLTDGTYYFVLKVQLCNGEEKTFTNYITIIR
jgi:uncharacterized repeat protein (TIGR01451 family)/gliding motility-associated-like protein